MQIVVTFNSLEEMERVMATYKEKAAAAQPEAKPKKEVVKKEEDPKPMKEEEKRDPEPAKLTLVEVRQAAKEYADANGKPALRKILMDMKAVSVPNMPESDWPAFMEKVHA